MKNYYLHLMVVIFLIISTQSTYARNECNLMVYKAPNNIPVPTFIDKKKSKNFNLNINQVDVLGYNVILEVQIGQLTIPMAVSSGQKYKASSGVTAKLKKIQCLNAKTKKRGLVAEVLSFATLYNLYNVYFTLVAAGSDMRSIHKNYRKPLQDIGIDTAFIKIGISPFLSKNPQNVAMTDCKNIYFPEGVDTANLFAGKKTNSMSLLLHELYHTKQCSSGGGRQNYALRWFKQLSLGIVSAIKKAKASDLHDAMPLEYQAENFAKKNGKTFYNTVAKNAKNRR